MIIKKIYLQQIIDMLDDDVKQIFGNTDDVYIDNITDVVNANETTLEWINPTSIIGQKTAESTRAKVILVSSTILYTPTLKKQNKILLVVEDPKVSLMKVLKQYFVKKPKPEIHPTAFVHHNARIGKNVYIGPHCYIGDCVIGDDNIIHANVSIYDRTVIGNNNVIHSGAVICVDGLGCVRDSEGTLTEFPQIGGVIIGDNTYIGANTHIASGSLSNTIIETGCKINGLCFIGSNNHLHENVWITGSTMLAGSVKVGKNTTIFSKVVIREWRSIGENVTIGMGAVVTKNVPDGEIWVGNPARKLE